jgi:hypothetical protein
MRKSSMDAMMDEDGFCRQKAITSETLCGGIKFNSGPQAGGPSAEASGFPLVSLICLGPVR